MHNITIQKYYHSKKYLKTTLPGKREKKETKDLLLKVAKEVALVWLLEFHDPGKVTSNYLSSFNGKYSWENTTNELSKKLEGTSDTNDDIESPFAVVIKNLQLFVWLT